MFRVCAAAALAVVVASGLQAVGHADAADAKKAALILNQPEGDPFGDLVLSGLQRLYKEEGVQAKLIAGAQPSAYEQQVRAMADQGQSCPGSLG